jgi:cytochrome oxidase assembly protein ShyY1
VLRVLLGPRWLGLHLLTVVVVMAFVLLGLWQLGRFEDSSTRAQVRAAAHPTPLAHVTRPEQGLTGGAAGRAVVVTGTYQPEQVLVPGRRLDGRRGLLVVAGLRTEAGGIVPVLRGWVPAPPAPAAPAGGVRVVGVLQPSETDSDAGVDPAAPLPAGQVPYVGSDVLAAALGTPDGSGLYDGYIALISEAPPPATALRHVPARPRTSDLGRWRNAGYAAQWWIFAAAVLGLWAHGVRDVLRRGRRRVPAPAP